MSGTPARLGISRQAEQLEPEGDWQTWMILAGRGFGKTRTGAEWTRQQVRAGATRLHLIAPTASDARDVMVEGKAVFSPSVGLATRRMPVSLSAAHPTNRPSAA